MSEKLIRQYTSFYSHAENNASNDEVLYLKSLMDLSDNNLLFTKNQFKAFAEALDRQFPKKETSSQNKFFPTVERGRGYGLNTFFVYPLNNGIKFAGLTVDKTLLSLPYISPNFHLYKPFYNSGFVDDVVNYWNEIATTNSKYVLLTDGRKKVLGAYLNCFNASEKRTHIGGGRCFSKQHAETMEPIQVAIEKYKSNYNLTIDDGILVVSC